MSDERTPDTRPEPIDTERLRALIDAATPGPWAWRGDADGSIELRGDGPFGQFDGRVVSALRSQPCIVALDDESVALAYDACEACTAAWKRVGRAGTSDPLLDLRCDKDENLGTVYLRGEVGIEPANKWAKRRYAHRPDIAEVDHPDARLIAEARTALPALLDEVDALRAAASELLTAAFLLRDDPTDEMWAERFRSCAAHMAGLLPDPDGEARS